MVQGAHNHPSRLPSHARFAPLQAGSRFYDVLGLLEKGIRHRVACGVVTDRPNAVWAQVRGAFYKLEPPPIEAVNPVGSGDSLEAGLVDGWLRQLDAPALLQHAVACGVANAQVWDAGAIDPAAVAALERDVWVEPIAPTRRSSEPARGHIRPGSSRVAARG